MANAPRRIECLDIATFQGSANVGAIVAFEDGEPQKSGYRLYKIRSVVGTDDFAAVAEVLRRRFRTTGEGVMIPDLLVVDGGMRTSSDRLRTGRSRRPPGSGWIPRRRGRGGRSR